MPGRLAAAVTDHLSSATPPGRAEQLPCLREALAALPDPRRARGVRHELLVVLVLACCAVLAGNSSYVAIAEWVTDSGPAVLDAVGWGTLATGRPLPCESTIRRLLNSIDAPALEAALCSWAARRLAGQRRLDPTRRLLPRAERTRVIALDGKTRRGSAQRGAPEADAIAAAGGGRVHLVAALDVEAGVVLGQAACDMVAGKGEEIATAASVLSDLRQRGLLAGAVVTMDALHTQRSQADYLHDAGADWIFTVKGNQPTLQARLKALNWADVPVGDRIRDVGHGRRETRTVYVMSIENIPDRDRYGVVEFFPHAAQAIKLIRRVRRRDGRWHTETVYAIPSLTYRDAHPGLLAAWIRGHWRIENSLHWVRDVTFGEDTSQVRVGSGPQVLSALANLAISALRLEGAVNIAAELRRHARDPLRTLVTFGLT
ncbi:ISAs1 family transposase [Quadrisphaera setariae]|uniref:ISAs1 family transposase n=1 Tax=Quadrisphaera setariae TaxID=2593304 RepID=UPI003F704987